ncbi:hypothetical protein [Ameyamaea chiangmaiensis]|uniref:Aminoglycoside phosphotransferase domain-containing protein n=1 Tax=Ameyamaea chiangmaiensis TaxID=442969 RepID=A0A850PDN7_9PROT|nr:hypothetical protein [Ameyamaea chiangmaiensis]NVN40799.1 hypothetical protein [Ameyamaea chiangmaiensis]
MSTGTASAAAVMAAARAGDAAQARALLATIVREEFSLPVAEITLGTDGYSLNSVNGFITTDSGESFFFKFHHEEGEDSVLQEFYRGEVLQAAGYPIDMPVHVCRRVGRQILLYRRRHTPRLADAARAVDHGDPLPDAPADALLGAQAALDDLTAAIYRASWHPIDAATSAAEPVHQLFFHRLVTPGRPTDVLGGRAATFFAADRLFTLPGATLGGADLLDLRWVIDGTPYHGTLRTCLESSLRLLTPAALAHGGGVVAHGDAHNANVWFDPAHADTPAHLTFFDPAFAGTHVPALLAEVKATFHNILAHPDWLYHPADLAAQPHIRVTDGVATVTSGWAPTPLRRAFLRGKAQRLWRPLLALLHAHDALGPEWRQTLRCALFCCPTLVMDLCPAGVRHTPQSALNGLAVAMMCGAEPERAGADPVARFLDTLDPTRADPDFASI